MNIMCTFDRNLQSVILQIRFIMHVQEQSCFLFNIFLKSLLTYCTAIVKEC